MLLLQNKDLYQLTYAEGSWVGNKDDEQYTLNMSYDTIGNIQSKQQVHEQLINGTNWKLAVGTNYNYSYIYDSTQPHAIY